MQVSKENKIQVLYDHYKDTFSYIREYLKVRDRQFIYVLLTITLMSFQIVIPEYTTQVLSQLSLKKLEFKLVFNPNFVSSMLWFVLLCIIIRYYQTSVTIERQYSYIHGIEEKLSNLLNDKLVYREGKGYLEHYPMFSSWVWALYSIIFPVLLNVITTAKIYIELGNRTSLGFYFIVDTLFYLMTLVSTVLYLLLIHFKK